MSKIKNKIHLKNVPNMKRFLYVIFLTFITLLPSEMKAQDDDYYNEMWYSCDLSSRQTEWTIKRFKEGLSWVNTLEAMAGRITFSDDCIEIYCYYGIQMHFPVDQYKRLSQNIFCVTRNGEDDIFDYIEVVKCEGREKGLYRFMLAKLDPDGTMQNTKLFICKPHSYTKAGSIEEARDSRTLSNDGFPPQVPKK